MQLLLVEDDVMIGEGLCQGLRLAGFDPLWARDGEAAEKALAGSHCFKAMLLDLSLPRKAGLEILQSLRDKGNGIPVLIITARDKVCDRVLALNKGADDYIMKPFDLDELAARVRAVLRRQHDQELGQIQVGALTLSPQAHEASVNGQAVPLSRSEFQLLEILAARPGMVFSRAQLEQAFYGNNCEIGSNTVEVYIHGLRKKLGPGVIQNIRGLGYMLSKKAVQTLKAA